MRSFSALVFAASAALSTAQVTSNPDGTFTCAIPNAAYCAGDSLSTNIIIRCTGTKGFPGNCNDNLDGEFPQGLNFAPCWQPSATSGEAACSKNCIVYGGSGNFNGTFTLPDCTPSATPSSSVSSATPVPTISYTTIVDAYTTVTVPCVSGTPIYTPSGVILSTASPAPSGSGSPAPSGSGSPAPGGNGTLTTAPGNTGSSATATPVGPTTTGPAPFTGAAVANNAGGLLAVVGFVVAYLF